MADVRVPAISVFLLGVHLFLSNAATPSPSPAPAPRYIIVDKFGGGNYTKIQDAIAAVPSNNSGPVDIWVKPGIYKERVIVPADKPFITLIGSIKGKLRAVITGKRAGSIMESATVSVLASDFVGQDLIIENTYGRGTQAVALRVSGDRVSFYGCRILSFQDTLFDEAGRHFYSDCLILGATDFICGNAASVFERCHVHSISPYGGAITAQRRTSLDEKTGFTFMDCNIAGVMSTLLGRPWGNYSRLIFAHTFMSEVILPKGWDDWADASRQKTAYFGEYDCHGPGYNTTGRVAWSRKLTRMEVEPFLNKGIIDGRTWIRRPNPTHPFSIGSIRNGSLGQNYHA